MSQSILIKSYPCERQRRSAVPLVLLHGWGNDSRVWEPMLPELVQHFDVIVVDLPGFGGSPPCQTWQQAIEAMVGALPEKFCLLGWSLGGMLAVQMAHQYPKRVEKLISLAANATFVSRSGWQTAMEPSKFDEFYQRFVANPKECIKQFASLQARGDGDERNLTRWLRNNRADIVPVPWLRGLDWLKQLDNRDALKRLKVPSLHIFGQNDALVSSDAAAKMAALSKVVKVKIMEGVSHAPQISQPAETANLVVDFLGASGNGGGVDPYLLQKRQIADSFSRAAASYDDMAVLQREVGERLLNRLPGDCRPSRIADMGCGTGSITSELASRFPDASCTGVDLSPGMVEYAARHHRHNSALQWMCGDAESLAFEDGQFDLIFSNFAFQWCQNLAGLMAEQWRILRPKGCLLFTTVGPQTLWQLRESWQQVDNYVHVNQFLPFQQVKEALAGQGFEGIFWQEETLTRHYDQLQGLTAELKAVGAHNLNRGRNSGLTGREKIQKLKMAYESYRTPQGLPADWELLYVVARKPSGVEQ